MAPSRGFGVFCLFRTQVNYSISRPRPRFYSSFIERATSPASKTQVYISRSLDPYINLSIEHYLLQKTPEDSTILFLYTNSRSLIIGRNQNPWTEVRLASLSDPKNGEPFQLVRRRSGGGTVMHDEGNVNYSVICPSKIFDRDKHAQMVVRALNGLGVVKAKVNCRHDIVLDKDVDGEEKTFKVSGSAYKITRLRSLHHGTCLLNLQNLKLASKLLTPTGKQWITARGVESVRSPITNVNVQNEEFERAVVQEFGNMYDANAEAVVVGEEESDIPEIAKGVAELRSEDWIFNQTPQFTFTTEIPNRENTAEGQMLPEDLKASFTIRHGRITESDIQHPTFVTSEEAECIQTHLLTEPLRSINWHDVFSAYTDNQTSDSKSCNPGIAFNHIFGTPGADATFEAYSRQHGNVGGQLTSDGEFSLGEKVVVEGSCTRE